MNTIRKELEFPAPPEGWEIEGYGLAEPGELFLDSDGKWKPCGERLKSLYFFVARKKQSPAEWANAQPLFQALAQIFCKHKDVQVTHYGNGEWIFDAAFMQRQTVVLGVPPPADRVRRLKLVNNKWEDTP